MQLCFMLKKRNALVEPWIRAVPASHGCRRSRAHNKSYRPSGCITYGLCALGALTPSLRVVLYNSAAQLAMPSYKLDNTSYTPE